MSSSTPPLIVLKELAGHMPTRLDPLQQFLDTHITIVTDLWISAWIITALVLLVNLWREYKNQNGNDAR